MWLGGLHGCNDWVGRTGRLGFSGGLLWTGRTGGRADAAEYGSLDEADWGGLGDWRTQRMQRTMESWTGRTRAVGADWGGRGGLAEWRTGGLADAADAGDYGILDGADCGRRERIGSSLEGRKGRTGKPGAGVTADWADRLGCACPVRLPSSRLRAEGIPGVLSPDADCGVIWLHTPRIHIRFFGAHVVVLFLGTHTSKAQRPSTSDKFLGSLEALNITYSMFIQMGHAIHDVVLGTSFASLHLLLFVDAVVQGKHLNAKLHEVDWMGYSAALPQSVRHLSREALKASQFWLRFLFVLRCQLRILIHILQWWIRMETSEFQNPYC